MWYRRLVRDFLPLLAVLASSLAPGCRLPGSEGPVPKSLANCRQLSQQGVTAAERGQHERAETLLAEAVKTCPVDPEARGHYADALWRRGAQKQAVAQLQEAVRLDGEDAVLHVRMAEMQLAMNQMGPAREHAEKALDLDPKLSAAWAIRGRVMRADGQHRQALADFHRALGCTPSDPALLLEIAELHRQLNQPQRALATLQSLAETCAPGEEPQQVLYLMGLAYVALGRYDDGIENLSAAAVRETPTPEILYRLAEAEWLAGRPGEAASAAMDALRLDPQHQRSRELLGRIELARTSQTAQSR